MVNSWLNSVLPIYLGPWAVDFYKTGRAHQASPATDQSDLGRHQSAPCMYKYPILVVALLSTCRTLWELSEAFQKATPAMAYGKQAVYVLQERVHPSHQDLTNNKWLTCWESLKLTCRLLSWLQLWPVFHLWKCVWPAYADFSPLYTGTEYNVSMRGINYHFSQGMARARTHSKVSISRSCQVNEGMMTASFQQLATKCKRELLKVSGSEWGKKALKFISQGKKSR